VSDSFLLFLHRIAHAFKTLSLPTSLSHPIGRFAVFPVPFAGEEVEFYCYPKPQPLVLPVFFKRPVLPPEDDEAIYFLRDWAVPMLASMMSMEKILTVVLALLTEIQMVVVCPDLQQLSATVLGFVCLLRPLKWAGPLIVTLPQVII